MKKLYFFLVFLLFSVLYAQNSSVINVKVKIIDVNGKDKAVWVPGDEMKIALQVDKDCYISILSIDAAGEKTWIPLRKNTLKAGKTTIFPDVPSLKLMVSDSGVYGTEQVLIYAATSEKGLPQTEVVNRSINQDLQSIMRRQRMIRSESDFASGMGKAVYKTSAK